MTTILVIEDEEIIRQNLADLLEMEGYQVLTAANGRIGVRLAGQHLPDLILCDIMMPKLNGYGVYQELSQDPITAIIPFIFLTAKTTAADVRAGMAHGADDYLIKPFSRNEVLKSITARLAKRATIVRHYRAKMDDLRQSMTRMLPHELRTPLTGIIGFSDILYEGYAALQPEEVREIAVSLQSASQRLYRLVQRFLLLSEFEIKSRDPEYVRALRSEYLPMTAGIIEDMAQNCTRRVERTADLTLDLQEAPAQINEAHFVSMLQELIENAFKFSLAGAPVLVSSRPAGAGMLELVISDRGRGMTAEQISAIAACVQFERKRYEQQGLGLGLALAQRIVELYDGRLTLDSLPNHGTTVRVTLPMAANASAR